MWNFIRTCAAGLLVLTLSACTEPPGKKSPSAKPSPVEKEPEITGPVKKIDFAKNVTVEIVGPKAEKRRVVIDATVCNRECQLELLLTGGLNQKKHEAILAADADASKIHAALLLAGAENGKPVNFLVDPPTPPSGTTIKITLEWKDKQGKLHQAPAQHWIKNAKTKKELKNDWVFAGSRVFNDPDGKRPPLYMANYGNLICLSNFDDAMLDVPVLSTKDNDDLVFQTWTERIPPVDTPVRVILEPMIQKKKQ
jgi:hypothetical protein